MGFSDLSEHYSRHRLFVQFRVGHQITARSCNGTELYEGREIAFGVAHCFNRFLTARVAAAESQSRGPPCPASRGPVAQDRGADGHSPMLRRSSRGIRAEGTDRYIRYTRWATAHTFCCTRAQAVVRRNGCGSGIYRLNTNLPSLVSPRPRIRKGHDNPVRSNTPAEARYCNRSAYAVRVAVCQFEFSQRSNDESFG
jgi:hypothetical protein